MIHTSTSNTRTIYKYPLEITDTQTLELPTGAQILAVQTQHNRPCLWALVDPEPNLPTEPITLRTFGTGHDIPVTWRGPYIGTYQIDSGAFVFHVFEELREESYA